MNRYFIEILENGQRMRTGNFRGYKTLAEAVKEAQRYVDDVMPQNSVRVMKEIGYANMAGDGGTYFHRFEDQTDE